MLDIVRRLKALRKNWRKLEGTPRSLAAFGMPDKDNRYIEETIDHLIDMASQLASVPTEQTATVQRVCDPPLGQLEGFFFATGNGEIPNMRLLAFITLLLQMQGTLKEAVDRIAGIRSPSPDMGANPRAGR